MTYRQFSYLVRRHKQELERQRFLIGIVASVTANYSMCHPEKPLCPADFMATDEKPLTEDEIAEQLALQLSVIAVPANTPAR
jgi:hypothetical protein